DVADDHRSAVPGRGGGGRAAGHARGWAGGGGRSLSRRAVPTGRRRTTGTAGRRPRATGRGDAAGGARRPAGRGGRRTPAGAPAAGRRSGRGRRRWGGARRRRRGRSAEIGGRRSRAEVGAGRRGPGLVAVARRALGGGAEVAPGPVAAGGGDQERRQRRPEEPFRESRSCASRVHCRYPFVRHEWAAAPTYWSKISVWRHCSGSPTKATRPLWRM